MFHLINQVLEAEGIIVLKKEEEWTGECQDGLNGAFPEHKCRCVMECIKQMPFFM